MFQMVYEIQPVWKNEHGSRTTSLKKINDKYDDSGLEYPVSFGGTSHFENINKVCVYVCEIGEDTNDIIECRKGNTQYIKLYTYLELKMKKQLIIFI